MSAYGTDVGRTALAVGGYRPRRKKSTRWKNFIGCFFYYLLDLG